MNAFVVAPGGVNSEYQIQKNIEKVTFRITAGEKVNGTSSAAQFLADAANIVVNLKRHSLELGEKTVWPRVTLLELLNSTLGIEGYAEVSGTDAATAYTAAVSIEVSMLGNINVAGGDYLALTVENKLSAGSVACDLIPGFFVTKDHFKMTKVALQAGESKRISVERAEFVVIPTGISEARIIGDDTCTLVPNTLEAYIREKSSFIVNFDGGKFGKPTAAVLPGNNIDWIDFVGGDNAQNILIFRQTDYNG